MITYPADGNGPRRKSGIISLVDIVATDRDQDDGCYELRFLDAYPTSINHLTFAWDSGLSDPLQRNTARKTVYIYDDGGSFSHHIGGTCASPSAS